MKFTDGKRVNSVLISLTGKLIPVRLIKHTVHLVFHPVKLHFPLFFTPCCGIRFAARTSSYRACGFEVLINNSQLGRVSSKLSNPAERVDEKRLSRGDSYCRWCDAYQAAPPSRNRRAGSGPSESIAMRWRRNRRPSLDPSDAPGHWHTWHTYGCSTAIPRGSIDMLFQLHTRSSIPSQYQPGNSSCTAERVKQHQPIETV